MMKRSLLSRLSALLLCLCLFSAVFPGSSSRAEDAAGSAPLVRLYRACENLLSVCSNMTAEGKADFLLDGTFFKHAEILLAQEDTNAYQQIELESTRLDGSIRKNGYAVADFDGEGYLVERYLDQAHVSPIGNPPKTRVVRPSVEADAVFALGRAVAPVLSDLLKDRISAEDTPDGLTLSLAFGEGEFPALGDAAINLLWQSAIRHFFGITFDETRPEGYAVIEDYMTPLQGILYCARELQLRSLSLEASLDDLSNLSALSGEGELLLICRGGETRVLKVSFSVSCRDYGSTVIREVIPEKNRMESLSQVNLLPSEIPGFFSLASARGISWEELGFPWIPVPESRLTHRTVFSRDSAVAYAQEICAMDFLGLPDADRLSWMADRDGSGWDMMGYDPESPDQIVLRLSFDEEGNVLLIRNCETLLEEAEPLDTDRLDSDDATAWREDLDISLWLFTEYLNPGSTGLTAEDLRDQASRHNGFTSYECTEAAGEETFQTSYGTLHRDPMKKVKYVIQTAPVVRLLVMDTTVPSEEGGNG